VSRGAEIMRMGPEELAVASHHFKLISAWCDLLYPCMKAGYRTVLN
jgi:hypothetical protein